MSFVVLAALLSPTAAAGADVRFEKAAGDWAGLVSELGAARYRLLLSLEADGSGRAVYPDFPCTTLLAPAAGERLLLTETVLDGRERCSDGMVEVVPGEGGLRWTWHDASGALRAVSVLTPVE